MVTSFRYISRLTVIDLRPKGRSTVDTVLRGDSGGGGSKDNAALLGFEGSFKDMSYNAWASLWSCTAGFLGLLNRLLLSSSSGILEDMDDVVEAVFVVSGTRRTEGTEEELDVDVCV